MATSLSPQRAVKFSRDCRRHLDGRATAGLSAMPTTSGTPHAYVEFGFSIDPAQGDLIYLLCRLLCR